MLRAGCWHNKRNRSLSILCTNNTFDRPFPSSPGPLLQNEGRCSAFDTEIIFHSHANKTHFHKKGCAPSLILKVRVFGTRNWPIKVKTSVPKGALSGPRSKATNPNWDNKMKNIC